MTTEFSDETLREACAWFARLNDGDATARDRLDHAIWLGGHPDRRAAYGFAAETCRLAATSMPATARGYARPGPGWRKLAAGVAAILVIPLGLGLFRDKPRIAEYRTAVGEERAVMLEDGSTLAISGASRLIATFDRHARTMELKDGEFFIQIARDSARPFRVLAGDRTIRDIGTAFDVGLHGRIVDVAVGAGVVVISPPETSSSPSDRDGATLAEGQAVSYEPDRAIGRPRAISPSQIGTWRSGILTYDEKPLAWLVGDLNRRFAGTIRIADPDLAAMPVTLTLKLRDRDTVIDTLTRLLPIQAVAAGDGAIELSRRAR